MSTLCFRFLSELSAQSDRLVKSSKSNSLDKPDWPQLATTTSDLQKQFPQKDAEAAPAQGMQTEYLHDHSALGAY